MYFCCLRTSDLVRKFHPPKLRTSPSIHTVKRLRNCSHHKSISEESLSRCLLLQPLNILLLLPFFASLSTRRVALPPSAPHLNASSTYHILESHTTCRLSPPNPNHYLILTNRACSFQGKQRTSWLEYLSLTG